MNVYQRSDGSVFSITKYRFGDIVYPRRFNFTNWTPEQLQSIGITLVPYVEPEHIVEEETINQEQMP